MKKIKKLTLQAQKIRDLTPALDAIAGGITTGPKASNPPAACSITCIAVCDPAR